MRLITQQHSEYKGKKYLKHWIVIPNKAVGKLGWKSGDELDAEVNEGKLVIGRY